MFDKIFEFAKIGRAEREKLEIRPEGGERAGRLVAVKKGSFPKQNGIEGRLFCFRAFRQKREQCLERRESYEDENSG